MKFSILPQAINPIVFQMPNVSTLNILNEKNTPIKQKGHFQKMQMVVKKSPHPSLLFIVDHFIP